MVNDKEVRTSYENQGIVYGIPISLKKARELAFQVLYDAKEDLRQERKQEGKFLNSFYQD